MRPADTFPCSKRVKGMRACRIKHGTVFARVIGLEMKTKAIQTSASYSEQATVE
jgi:hypothetical protein